MRLFLTGAGAGAVFFACCMRDSTLLTWLFGMEVDFISHQVNVVTSQIPIGPFSTIPPQLYYITCQHHIVESVLYLLNVFAVLITSFHFSQIRNLVGIDLTLHSFDMISFSRCRRSDANLSLSEIHSSWIHSWLEVSSGSQHYLKRLHLDLHLCQNTSGHGNVQPCVVILHQQFLMSRLILVSRCKL